MNIIKPKKSRKRHKPSSSTVMPDFRMRTDHLEQIQRDHYVSTAGVDYDADAVDELLRIRYAKREEQATQRAIRERRRHDRLIEQGKVKEYSAADYEKDNNSKSFSKEDFEDCIF